MLKSCNKRAVERSRLRDQRGVIFELALLLTPALLLLVATVINSNYLTLKKTKIQAISDAAAHAGTVMLDFTPASWELATQGAIKNLKLHVGELPEISLVNFTAPIAGTTYEFHSSDSKVKIFIRRGQYQPPPSSEEDGKFVSLEPGENPYQGILPWIMANGVKVQIEITDTRWIFPVIGEGGFSIAGITTSTNSTVIVDKVEPVPVPPFALPLCALFDSNGEFDFNTLCKSDRLFTLGDSTQFTSSIPDFMYDPGINSNHHHSCYWNSPQYENYLSNWGVLGLPVQYIDQESTVAGVLNVLNPVENPTGMAPARLGQPFAPLMESVSTQEQSVIGEKLWAFISGALSVYHQDVHVPFADALAQAVQEQNGAQIQPNWLPFTQSDWALECICADGCPCTDLASCTLPSQQTLCRSRRFDWSGCVAGTDPHNYATLNPLPAGQLWKVLIPVIADGRDSAPTCAEMGQQTVVSDGKYTIIGFVTMHIYDTDFGLPRAHRNLPEYKKLKVASNGAPKCSLGAPPFLPEIPTAQQPPPACNVVRARLDCNTSFLAHSRGDGAPHKTWIVE